MGDLAQGVGIQGAPPREVAFSIGLTPSTFQIGQRPSLIRKIVLTGTDIFTEKPVSIILKDVDTNLTEDPGFPSQQANVVQ